VIQKPGRRAIDQRQGFLFAAFAVLASTETAAPRNLDDKVNTCECKTCLIQNGICVKSGSEKDDDKLPPPKGKKGKGTGTTKQ
jgi:hypothetical protein